MRKRNLPIAIWHLVCFWQNNEVFWLANGVTVILWLASPIHTQGGAVNLSQTSRLRPTSITHSLLGLHSIVTQSTVVFTDSQPRLPPTPADHNDSLIRSLSHPPRNTISPKMGNYSKKYLHVIFMGWGLKCGRGIHCILRVRNWKTSSFKVIWNNNQTHNFLWRWKKKTCLSFQFRLLVV